MQVHETRQFGMNGASKQKNSKTAMAEENAFNELEREILMEKKRINNAALEQFQLCTLSSDLVASHTRRMQYLHDISTKDQKAVRR